MTLTPEELRERDAEARLRAQSCFDRPFVLEAGAGTGKTATLVARVLAWCLGPGWHRHAEETATRSVEAEANSDRVARKVLAGVAAITFTEAAAAEMSSRIGSGLVALARGESVLGFDSERLELDATELCRRAASLLGALDHLGVHTIHAFCRRLLARYPLECGWHPEFDVDSDGRRREVIVRECVAAGLREANRAGAGDPLFDLLASGTSLVAVEEAVSELVALGVDAAALKADPFEATRVLAYAARTRDACEALRRAIGGALDDLPAKSTRTRHVREAIDEGLEALDAALSGDESDASAASLLEAIPAIFEKEDLGRLDKWGRAKPDGPTEEKALGPVIDAVAPEARAVAARLRGFIECDRDALEQSLAALRGLVAAADEAMRSRGVVGFEALLVTARALLRDRPEVRCRLRSELDQLLVDEFQDTSALQCEIVRWLALEGEAAERPGLFLVGDPKQSVYGWRDADLAAYDAFIQEVRDAGGEVATLSVNYRSVEAILEEVTRVIEPVMHQRTGFQPRFERLVVAPEHGSDPGFVAGESRSVEYGLSWRRNGNSFETNLLVAGRNEVEAVAVAEDLRRQHDEHGVAWGDMALLFRGLTDLERYLAALRVEGVPFAVERDRNYFRRREVVDASALLCAVLDPNDVKAMVTLLRSSAVGVPDAAWLPLWRRGFPGSWSRLREGHPEGLAAMHASVAEAADEVAALEADVPGLERVQGWERNLQRMLTNVATLRGIAQREPPDVFLEELRGRTLFELVEAGRYLGPHRQANLERFFREVAAQWLADADPGAILRRLRQDIAQGREAEEAPPPDAARDAVRIMTIHKAKGLDFDHVYIPQLGKGTRSDPPGRLYVWGDPAAPELEILGARSLGASWERFRAKELARLERVRLLYVAMTRAKKRLVLLGGWPEVVEPKPLRNSESFLDLLSWRRPLQPDLAAWIAEGDDFEHGLVRDDAGARWWLPKRSPAGPRRFLEASAETAASASGLLQPGEPIAPRRIAAERRMQRAFGAPVTAASGEGHGPRDVEASDEFKAARVLTATSRDVAALAGTGVHRALEAFDFEAADASAEIERLCGALAELLPAGGPEQTRAEAVLRAARILRDFASGPLFSRFLAAGEGVAARELDLLVGPDASDDEVVAYRVGAIDLLYRESGESVGSGESTDSGKSTDSGVWVVVDFKTDEVVADEAAERAQRYHAQARDYRRAVQQALQLAAPPRVEFWFLVPGVVVAA